MSGIRYSIVITCHNQAHFIRDAVESVLAQSYPSKEVIVVDDASCDDSLLVLREYEPAITLLHLPINQGASAARNRGSAAATGEYVIFLDGDDLITPWALNVYEWLITEHKPAVILSRARWFNGTVPALGAETPTELEFFEYPCLMTKDRSHGINIGAVVIDRLAFQSVGGWTPEIFHLDGQDLFAKLAYSGPAVVVNSSYTMLYRIHASNSIHSVPPFLKSAHLIIEREHAGIYPGGRHRRFERYARHGGTIVFCLKKALRAHLYMDALRLAISGRKMIIAAMIQKVLVRIRGRRPLQKSAFSMPGRDYQPSEAQRVG